MKEALIYLLAITAAEAVTVFSARMGNSVPHYSIGGSSSALSFSQ